jgi:class 3 adenylate cyclase/tetratricopeptide (TPR) repeat protein
LETSLTPYLARLAAEWELDTPGERWSEFDATCCFVDISGFTALSERLARRGRIGAEELTEVLNFVFGKMLAVAYEKGGSLLKFGGDALLLAFFEGDHAVLGSQAAVAMRAALREARTFPTSVGRLNLRMSVGVHSGRFQFFRVGASHKELLVAGPAATATTRMEQIAEAGEIVVSTATAERLPARAIGSPKGDGHLLRWRAVVEGGPGARAVRSVDPAVIDLGIPVALRQHLHHGAGDSEHRLASVGFVKFQGTDDHLASHGADATAAALDELVTATQQAADAEGVTFLASDIDANGGKLILVAGVPTARDDDEGRMLRAARAILDRTFAVPVKIGVNRGHVFAGDVGAPFRRSFTVMGDTVNLAARLMAAAKPGELYATADVLDRSRTMFATEALEPFHVKGKAQPIQAYRVGDQTGVRTVATSSLPFVGREDVIARLSSLAEASDTGYVVDIEADRGAGKTRLLEEFVTACHRRVLVIRGEAYASSSPYLALREPLRELLEIDAEDSSKAGLQLADRVAALVPEKAALAPLFAQLLGLDLSPTPESAAIAEKFWRDTVGGLLTEVLAAAAPDLLLVVDDAQWLDDASGGVLERVFVAARDRGFLCVTARRPAVGGFRPAEPDDTIVLAPLDEKTASDLVDTVTAAAPLRPQERDQVVARAAGSPLFLEELLRLARASDFDALPETLDAVAMQEIDALPPAARRVVRYASVLGRVFRPQLLLELLGSDALEPAVSRAVSSQIVSAAEHMHFRHALLQEAAYESLPFRKRVELHRRAGEAIERDVARDLEGDVALLSLHFFRAQEWASAWTYARGAGRQAAESHAPAEAATHFEQAIVAARRLGDVPARDVVETYMQLAKALVTLGLFVKADGIYRRAAAALSDDPLERALIGERRSYVRCEYMGQPVAAVRHIRAGIALLDAVPVPDDEKERVRARLLAREADLRCRQGRLREAERLCRAVIASAGRLGEDRALAMALTVLDSCLLDLNRGDEATNMPRALEAYERLGDQLYVAITLGNLGAVAHMTSRWLDAADYCMSAMEASTKVGDLGAAAIARATLGEIQVGQGRLDDAVALLVPAVRTLESFGYRLPAASTMLHLGRARVFLGDTDEGFAMLRTATATLDDARVPVYSLEARARTAEAAVFAGDLELATRALVEARAYERTIGESQYGSLVDRVEVTLAIKACEDARAVELLVAAEPRARKSSAKYELLCLLALADHLGIGGSEQERGELARELGVARLAALPELSRLDRQ